MTPDFRQQWSSLREALHVGRSVKWDAAEGDVGRSIAYVEVTVDARTGLQRQPAESQTKPATEDQAD
jgi:hypothetical protein